MRLTKRRCLHCGKPSAARLSYALSIGTIEKNKRLRHGCGNRLCVNPKHLKVIARKGRDRGGR